MSYTDTRKFPALAVFNQSFGVRDPSIKPAEPAGLILKRTGQPLDLAREASPVPQQPTTGVILEAVPSNLWWVGGANSFLNPGFSVFVGLFNPLAAALYAIKTVPFLN